MTAMFVSTEPATVRDAAPTSEQPGILAVLHDWVVTVDHKRLGIMYVVTGLVFLVIGGLEAFLMRLQLASPGLTLVPPDTWFTQEVIAEGNHIIIKVNDKVAVDFVDEKKTYTKGHMAFQQHNLGSEVWVRNVQVKELPKK